LLVERGARKKHCKDDGEAVKAFVLASITSETEFVITNGRSKLLRLPEGEYRYVVEPYVAPLGENVIHDSEPQLESRGSLTWAGSYPKPVINDWNPTVAFAQ